MGLKSTFLHHLVSIFLHLFHLCWRWAAGAPGTRGAQGSMAGKDTPVAACVWLRSAVSGWPWQQLGRRRDVPCRSILVIHLDGFFFPAISYMVSHVTDDVPASPLSKFHTRCGFWGHTRAGWGPDKYQSRQLVGWLLVGAAPVASTRNSV